MKKRFVKLITLILSVIIGLAGLSGCRLVTKNAERDLAQTIAEVNINQKDEITKKDLLMSYMNYGYMYVQYYGYTQDQVYSIILNNLIDNRIIIQVAYEKFENEEGGVKNENKPKYNPERYLDDDEIIDAKYSTYKSFDNLLETYSSDNTYTEKKDTLPVETRTVPTDAKNAEKDIDKAAFVAEIDENGFDVTSEFRRVAYDKVCKLLKDASLLGDFGGDLKKTVYFDLLLKSNLESEVINNYDESIVAGIKENISYEQLETLFNEKLNKQRAWSNSEFVDALNNAGASSPVLWSNQEGKYGYVYNLLLGVNDYQSAKITELQKERSATNMDELVYAEKRAEILSGTVAQDLRSSWILAGYDFDYATKKFTGDYTFAKDAEYSLEFKGEVDKERDADEEHDLAAVYNVKSIDVFRLGDFVELVNDYVYGNEGIVKLDTDDNADIYAAYKREDKPVEYDAKINELLFAFSTDPGSLNTYKGYVIKPDNNDYVKTFGEAGKALLEEGGSGYKVVASDYGYHFMFFSEVWEYETGYADLGSYLDSLGIENEYGTWDKYLEEMIKNWDDFQEENNFLYILVNELISSKLSDANTRTISNVTFDYRYGDHKDCTKIYNERFADVFVFG
ncbi:MAG: hypothetical protein J5911_00605 [Clostridia bacterium]|nr:hypothetical protein [Clostridia bacterium]